MHIIELSTLSEGDPIAASPENLQQVHPAKQHELVDLFRDPETEVLSVYRQGVYHKPFMSSACQSGNQIVLLQSKVFSPTMAVSHYKDDDISPAYPVNSLVEQMIEYTGSRPMHAVVVAGDRIYLQKNALELIVNSIDVVAGFVDDWREGQPKHSSCYFKNLIGIPNEGLYLQCLKNPSDIDTDPYRVLWQPKK